jgi:hypothetical protein
MNPRPKAGFRWGPVTFGASTSASAKAANDARWNGARAASQPPLRIGKARNFRPLRTKPPLRSSAPSCSTRCAGDRALFELVRKHADLHAAELGSSGDRGLFDSGVLSF